MSARKLSIVSSSTLRGVCGTSALGSAEARAEAVLALGLAAAGVPAADAAGAGVGGSVLLHAATANVASAQQARRPLWGRTAVREGSNGRLGKRDGRNTGSTPCAGFVAGREPHTVEKPPQLGEDFAVGTFLRFGARAGSFFERPISIVKSPMRADHGK